MKLTPSTIGKAELNVKLADRRVAEIIYMANKGDAQRVEAVTQRLDKRLVTLAGLVSVQKEDGASQVETSLPAAAPPKEAEAPKVLAPASVPSEKARSGGEDDLTKMDRRAKLRATVVRYAVSHPAALRAVLEKAPASSKPALLRAIAVSETGYEKALESLD